MRLPWPFLAAVHEEGLAGRGDERCGIALLNVDVVDMEGLGVKGRCPGAEQQPQGDCDKSREASRRAVLLDNRVNTMTVVRRSAEHLDSDRILRPDAAAVNRFSGTSPFRNSARGRPIIGLAGGAVTCTCVTLCAYDTSRSSSLRPPRSRGPSRGFGARESSDLSGIPELATRALYDQPLYSGREDRRIRRKGSRGGWRHAPSPQDVPRGPGAYRCGAAEAVGGVEGEAGDGIRGSRFRRRRVAEEEVTPD